MDGLLVDTEAAYRDCMVESAAAIGLAMPAELCRAMTGLTWAQCDAPLTAHFGAEFPLDDFKMRTHAAMEQRAAAGIAAKAGAHEMLDALDALGLKRAIATSSGHASVRAHLAPSGLLSRFDIVV